MVQQAKKLEAKAREEPLVVVGCILTVSALAAGLVSFLRGNSHLGNQLMQARILAQGGTVTGEQHMVYCGVQLNIHIYNRSFM